MWQRVNFFTYLEDLKKCLISRMKQLFKMTKSLKFKIFFDKWGIFCFLINICVKLFFWNSLRIKKQLIHLIDLKICKFCFNHYFGKLFFSIYLYCFWRLSNTKTSTFSQKRLFLSLIKFHFLLLSYSLKMIDESFIIQPIKSNSSIVSLPT